MANKYAGRHMKGSNAQKKVNILRGFKLRDIDVEPVQCRGYKCNEMTVDMRGICPKCREKMN